MRKISLLILSLILVVSIFVLASCQNSSKGSESKTTGGTTTDIEDVIQEDEVNMKISGYVVDEFNNPVAGASITIGDKTAVSGNDGSYSLTVLRAETFDITATKDGYFEGESKDLNEGKIKENTSLLNVQIQKKHYVKGKVVDGSSGTIEVAKGAEVFVITDKKYSVPVNDDGTYELEFAAVPFTDRTVLFFEYKGYANTYLFIPTAKSITKDAATADIPVAPNTFFSGTVTLKGKPLKNAMIKIQPKIDTSAAHNQAVKTIETVLYTDSDGKFKTSDKQLICFSTEYNVILEYRDLFGNATNEKGDKVTVVTKTVKVTDSREFVVDFNID